MAGTIIQVLVALIGILGLGASLFVLYQQRDLRRQVSRISEVLSHAGPGMTRRLEEGRSAVVMPDLWADSFSEENGNQ